MYFHACLTYVREFQSSPVPVFLVLVAHVVLVRLIITERGLALNPS